MSGRLRALAMAGALLIAGGASAQVRVNAPTNKHNLSVTGPGPMKATTMTEICVFCHRPHNANPAVPLWNQTLSTTGTYTPYTSTTMAEETTQT